jgi:hypothetical protein
MFKKNMDVSGKVVKSPKTLRLIDEEINDLVSSYFMKTLLLWEIQTNSQHNVGPDSLLQVFLNCLQRLYTWVKEENCPNFFIPENNMSNKVFMK